MGEPINGQLSFAGTTTSAAAAAIRLAALPSLRRHDLRMRLTRIIEIDTLPKWLREDIEAAIALALGIRCEFQLLEDSSLEDPALSGSGGDGEAVAGAAPPSVRPEIRTNLDRHTLAKLAGVAKAADALLGMEGDMRTDPCKDVMNALMPLVGSRTTPLADQIFDLVASVRAGK